MNEQIKALATQAGFSLYSKTYYENVDIMNKFAELIIKECLAQSDKVVNMLEDDSEKLGATRVGYAIEKHFGIQ